MAKFTNVAVVNYSGRTAVSNRVTGRLPETPTGSKSVLPAQYLAGEVLTYVVALRNNSWCALEDLTVTDDLGAMEIGGMSITPLTFGGDVLLYVDGVLQTAPEAATTDPLVFRGINLPPKASLVLVYRARVNAFAPLEVGAEITNTASVAGGWLQDPLEYTATATAAVTPDLTLTKAVDPETVPEGGQMTYTFTVENRGNSLAIPPKTRLTDTFNPILKNIAVTYDGETWTNFNYSEETGEFASALLVPAATFTREDDGTVTVTPGRKTVTVTGRI